MRRLGLLSIVCGLALAMGCAGLRGEREATSSERRAYEEALHAGSDAEGGGEAAAMQALQQFIATYPRSGLADDASQKLAELQLVAGDREAAFSQLYWAVDHHPRGDRSDEIRLLLARLELQRSDAEAASKVLRPIRLDRLPDGERRAAHRLLAQVAADPAEKLRWLAAVRADVVSGLERDPERDPSVLGRVDAQIATAAGYASVDELERAADKIGEPAPAALLRLWLAERQIQAGDLGKARRQLARAERAELGPLELALLEQTELSLELRERLESIDGLLPTFAEAASLPQPQTAPAAGTLGVVLPLSGPYARYGEESLKGILLATRVFTPPEPDAGEGMPAVSAPGSSDSSAPGASEFDGTSGDWKPLPRSEGVRLLVRDSAGSPELGARAVRDLARRGVAAIIGPLRGDVASAAAEAAEDENIPLLALTAREEVPRGRSYVFRLRTTPSDEVGFLVDYAISQRGARRFAILYPHDEYGRGMRDRFWRDVTARGGSVVAVGGYEPDATDFADAIRTMTGYVLLTSLEKKALGEREEFLRRGRRLPPEQAAIVREVAYSLLGPEKEPLPPVVDFDALFIPDAHDKVVLIAPQLDFHEVNDVQLLGPGGWVHPELVEIAEKHVRGAIISALFYPETRFDYITSFVERFSTTYGASPDEFAAQAYDAASLVLVQLARGADSHRAIRDGILRTHGYAGVSGVISFMPDGNARKRPFLIGVSRKKFVSLD